jgi:hypothetical protein
MAPASAAIDHHQSAAGASCDAGDFANASALEIFRERCEARAMLVANGLMDLQDAVDGLQESAAAQGLVATHGQDRIQRIMAESFARRRYDDR